MAIIETNGVRILRLDADGPVVTDATDIIGETWGERIDLVAIPVERLDPGFLDLSTRVAGEFTQKFANYRLRLVVLGDIAARTATSEALAAYVRESNRGDQVWFVRDDADLDAVIARRWPTA